MGVVYKAEDTRLDRVVALKVLAAHLLTDEEAKRRFEREAKAAAALDHPNIATVFEVGEDNGQSFIAQQFIGGTTIADKIAERPLPFEEFVDIAIQVSEGLQAAHEKGVVHRDIKGANILVNSKGQAKIIDFGLAHSADRSKLTKTGTTLGTPAYMSPEQVQGQPIDRRSDIWSFGVLLYEMITGRHPFPGEYDQAVLYSIINEEPEPVTALRSGVPVELDRIITKALAKKVEDRYSHVDDLLVDLRSLRSASPTPRPSSPPRPFTAPPKTWLVAVVSVALLALCVGGYFAWNGSTSLEASEAALVPAVPGQKMIAVLPFENLGAPEDEYFADGMSEEIISRMVALEGLGVISRTSAMQYKQSSLSLKQIGAELGVEYVLAGTVRWQRASEGPTQVRVTPRLVRVSEDVHLWTERYDAVLADIFEVQSDIARQVVEKLDVALLEPQRQALEASPTKNLDAYDAYLRGNDYFDRGRELHAGDEVLYAIRMYEQAQRLDPSFSLACARQSVAHAWLYTWYFDRTSSRLESAAAALDQALELDSSLAEAHYAAGILASFEKDWDRALSEYRTALDSQPGNSEILMAIGDIQMAQGRWEESLDTMKMATRLNPRLGSLACWTGGRYLAMGDYSEAIRYHDRSVQLTPDRACPYYCELLIYLNWDGSTGRAEKFLAELPAHIDLEESPPINYPWVVIEMIEKKYAQALERLSSRPSQAYSFWLFYVPKDLLAAQVYGLMGQPERARASYEAARGALETKVQEQPDDDRFRSALGIVYAGLGRRDDAVREGKLGLELLAGNENFALGYRLKDLAQIYAMVGDHDEAINQLERLLSVPSHFGARYFSIDPAWNSLRDEPRFQALLEKYTPR